jgi:hypothetical protein
LPFLDNPPEKLGGGGICVGNEGGLWAGLLCPYIPEARKKKMATTRPMHEKFFVITIYLIY